MPASSRLAQLAPPAAFAAHRARVFDALASLGVTSGLAYLRGDVTKNRHNTDAELAFRQESNFYYATGVAAHDYHAVLDIGKRQAVAFAPNISDDEAVWIGKPKPLGEQAKLYGVETKYVDELAGFVGAAAAGGAAVHVLEHETDVSALGASVLVDRTKLSKAFTEARMRKTDTEIALMKHANDISSRAHEQVMRALHPSSSETELEAVFRYHCHSAGTRDQAYLPIVGGGEHASVLHYGHNAAPLAEIAASEHALLLVDAGCEVNNYASDITRCAPVHGKFTPEARAVYETVLLSQEAVLQQLKAGVKWEDMHRLAARVIAEGLADMGILKGGSVDEYIAAHAHAVFFPHGLGHLLGLDVHDVGGYPEGVGRIQEPGIRYLRMRRDLEPGFVVTVEPGLYFVPLLLEQAKNTPAGKFIDYDAVARYSPVGGVRIEDNVVITETGYINLTTAAKTVEQIEAIMAGGAKERSQA